MRKRPNKEKYRYDLIPKHLLERVTVDPDTGCWNFKGSSPSSNGYERCWLWGTRWQAHRLFYELVTGVDIRLKQLDHLCVNRKCCNPEHMDPVTPTINAKRIFRRRKGPPEFISLPAGISLRINQ